jgi:polysaccharide deacetylase family protein (PEP-CTERM system associated)
MADRSRYILSVDVEDYFQVEAFAKVVPRSDWDRWPSRVSVNTHRVLDLLDEFGVKGTFFTLGWVADKFPEVVREIHCRGHELACHSFWHRPVYSLTPGEFREDLVRARDAIEQAAGVRVVGYRAPSWSITARSLWALDILVEEGFLYDSSIFPIRHDLYGIPGAKRHPYQWQAGRASLTEFPPATVKLGGQTLPAAGGGYLRIFPLRYNKWAMERLNQEFGEKGVVVVYLHPWEVDPEQPRIAAPLRSRFRHYTNLGKMEPRLRNLLRAYSFEPFSNLVGVPVSPAASAESA